MVNYIKILGDWLQLKIEIVGMNDSPDRAAVQYEPATGTFSYREGLL